MNMKKLIEKAKKECWKVCIYGLGLIGANCGTEFVEYLGFTPDYYADRCKDTLEEFQVDFTKKIFLDELLAYIDDILVFLFIGNKYIKEACEMFEKHSNIHIVTWMELIDCDEIIKKYFGISELVHSIPKKEKSENKKRRINETCRIAIYTCITGGYDELTEPMYVERNCDYFLITDNAFGEIDESESVYKKINVLDVVPKQLTSPKEQNRYCKSHGYEIFKDYDYSIYVDGNLQITGRIVDFVELVGEKGLALHKNTWAKDPYHEAISLSVRLRIKKDEAEKTMREFVKEGVPRDIGMTECGVIVCENNNSTAKKILSEWFEYYKRGEIKRDQIYMYYTLWKNKIDIEEICTLPGSVINNGYFKVIKLHSGYQR